MKLKSVFVHILFWVYGLLIINIPKLDFTVGYFNASDVSLLIPSIYGTIINSIIFYGNWKFLLKKHLQKNKLHYWVLLFFGLGLLSYSESLIDAYYLKNYQEDKNYEFISLLTDNFAIHFIFFLLPSFGFWYYENYLKIKKKQYQLQEEKLKAEISLLRAQIDPHFLFNVLNNLFGSAHQFGDVKTANGISNLAELMRYMIYDSIEEEVSLEKELSYIDDFIELQKLRFDQTDNLNIKFKNSIENANTLSISPMLFIPFAENAFKYGVSLDKHSLIDISFSIVNDKLIFSCVNTIHNIKKQSKNTNGFGLDNIKKRLELLYPNLYILDINTDQKKYNVNLEIKII
ncbi:sensor histidine kinase [Tenacibaculum sp. MEBiC06402]|uniref:sensor histidine kinase n=1 Tax=unclassified Tenacibaculum TaxID=2635139 RepID=UPI003B998E2D